MQELRKHYEWLDEQNEVGDQVSMSASATTSITEDKMRPSTESNSAIDGGSASKKPRTQRRVLTALEKEILENLYIAGKLKDKKSRENVVLILSKDDNKLSEAQVKTWVDNYKESLKWKK